MHFKKEYALNVSNINAVNTQNAESRMRDVDLAKEMLQYTKENILSQAAQTILTQNNQQPQEVLQLLR